MEDDVVQQIESDDFYKQFLVLTAKTQTMAISEQIKKLGDGIDALNKELQKQVLEKHEDLLLQANHATRLDNVLNIMNNHVQNLFANVERLKMQINTPYNALDNHTKVLARLHLASHILRQVSRIQQLSKRLSNTNDPIAKATILYELEQLANDENLTDIDAVSFELRNVREQKQNIVKLANGSLNQGVNNENIAQTTTALQIFNNLNLLNDTLKIYTENGIGEIKEALKTTFDVSQTSNIQSKSAGKPGKLPILQNTTNFRNKIWLDLEKLFSEDIFLLCKKIKFLQIKLFDFNLNYDFAHLFWKQLNELLNAELSNNNQQSMKQMLQEEYPKLLRVYLTLISKIAYEKFNYDRNLNVFEELENAYLSNSLTKLIEPTQAMFNAENISPSHDQIDNITQIITSELSMALVEENLLEKISKNIAKCIKVYSIKTEQLINIGVDSNQVIAGAMNTSQTSNVQLANSMHYFKIQIQRIMNNMQNSLSKKNIEIITETLQNLDNLTKVICQPIIDNINKTVETIIVTLHLESDWNKINYNLSNLSSNRNNMSPYMKELTQFLLRVYNIYLTPFENKDVISQKSGEIVIRCIELFIRHISILRPLNQGGRVRIQSDFDHLERTLKVLCPYLEDLGYYYRLFRSVSTLIVLSPQEIANSQVGGSSVPPSTVLFILFAFAGSELASPHQNTGWSLPKLSSWLDVHTNESDRLDLIAGALQKYVTIVRQKNSTNYDPVYPIMANYLESVINVNK